MSLIDRSGRLGGRWSIVDLLALLFLLCLTPLVPYGLKVLRPMPPEILTVAPGRCSPGESVRIIGTNFRQGLRVTFGGMPAAGTEYYGTDLVIAYVPPELPPGNYPVRLENPRGGTSTWEKPLELIPAGPRPTVSVIVTCAFTDLSPEEADFLESSSKEAGAGDWSAGPSIVRVLKRGPMETLREKTRETDKGKEYVFADIAVLGEIVEMDGQKRYFYRNQPLIFELPLRFSLGNRPFSGVIRREPDPDRIELKRGDG